MPQKWNNNNNDNNNNNNNDDDNNNNLNCFNGNDLLLLVATSCLT